jgi:hypothetical protein
VLSWPGAGAWSGRYGPTRTRRDDRWSQPRYVRWWNDWCSRTHVGLSARPGELIDLGYRVGRDDPPDPGGRRAPARAAAYVVFLLRDRDSKFTEAFDDVLSGNGTRVIKTLDRSLRANSFAERVGGKASPQVPGSRADPRRAACPQGRSRVRPALQRPAAESGQRQKPSLHQTDHAVDIAARIERRRVFGALISEYGRAALRAQEPGRL